MDARERHALEYDHDGEPRMYSSGTVRTELRGLDTYLTTDRREPEPPDTTEMEREQRWWEFEIACKEFAASERDGYGAVLRAVARAMNEQTELLPPTDPRRV